MHKNFVNVKIHVMVGYCRNPAFEFPKKNKLGKKNEQRKQINQIIWYSSTATVHFHTGVYTIPSRSFRSMTEKGWKGPPLYGKGPSLRDEQTQNVQVWLV